MYITFLSYNRQSDDAILLLILLSINFSFRQISKVSTISSPISCQSKSVGKNKHVWERKTANELEKWIYFNLNMLTGHDYETNNTKIYI